MRPALGTENLIAELGVGAICSHNQVIGSLATIREFNFDAVPTVVEMFNRQPFIQNRPCP
jgi:hypothetical protein